jgi:hypothetical protein
MRKFGKIVFWAGLLFVGIQIFNLSSRDTIDYKPLTHEQEISQGFSPLTGEHKKLKSMLLTALKDPDSYSHIKTSYVDTKEHLIVTMTYRAKNSFGALAVNTFSAITKPNGDVVKIIEN